MDFGKALEAEEFEKIKFHLPDFPSITGEKSHFYLGGPHWAESAYKGGLYPQNAKTEDFLSLYAGQFDSLELNATYHNLPTHTQVDRWFSQATEANKNFKFCPKILKKMSHEGKLDCHFDLLPIFINTIKRFGENLGPCFLQLGPGFTPSRFEELRGFLEMWPKEFPLAVEVRHEAWFNNKITTTRIHELFLKHNVSMVITDTHFRRDVIHTNVYSNHLIIRYVGFHFHELDQARLNNWAAKLKQFSRSGPKEIYFFFHDDEYSIFKSAQYFGALLSSDFSLKVPRSIERLDHGQMSFF